MFSFSQDDSKKVKITVESLILKNMNSLFDIENFIATDINTDVNSDKQNDDLLNRNNVDEMDKKINYLLRKRETIAKQEQDKYLAAKLEKNSMFSFSKDPEPVKKNGSKQKNYTLDN